MPLFHCWKGFAWVLLQNENPISVHQLGQSFVCQQFFGEALAVLHFFVRRISKDDIKHLRAEGVPEEIKDILLSNPSFQFCFGEIAFDDLCRLSICLDKDNRGRATAKRFNSQRAASCEKIEDARAR